MRSNALFAVNGEVLLLPNSYFQVKNKIKVKKFEGREKAGSKYSYYRLKANYLYTAIPDQAISLVD